MNRVVTPALEARIRDLKAQGLSNRAVVKALAAEGTKISDWTVNHLLKEPETPAVARARAAESLLTEDSPRPFPLAKSLGVPGDEDAPVHPPEIQRLHERLERVRELGEQAANDDDLTGFRDMAKLELELTSKLVGLTPPKPPKPEDDPANVAARDAARGRILDMIEDSEHRCGRMCSRCMLDVAKARR